MKMMVVGRNSYINRRVVVSGIMKACCFFLSMNLVACRRNKIETGRC
jgi:hypothetical protein